MEKRIITPHEYFELSDGPDFSACLNPLMRFEKSAGGWQVTEGGETFFVSDEELNGFAYHGYFVDTNFDPHISYRFILSAEEKEALKVDIVAVTESVVLNGGGLPRIVGEGSVLARFKDGSISIFTREEEERMFERISGFDPRRNNKLTKILAAMDESGGADPSLRPVPECYRTPQRPNGKLLKGRFLRLDKYI